MNTIEPKYRIPTYIMATLSYLAGQYLGNHWYSVLFFVSGFLVAEVIGWLVDRLARKYS